MKSLGVYVCLSFASAASLVYGCSSNGGVDGDWSEQGEVNAAPPSFEEYRESARLASDNGDLFIVEGDMLFDDEDNLREYYEELYWNSAEKSIIDLVNGVRDVRPNPRNIRYCFSAGWG